MASGAAASSVLSLLLLAAFAGSARAATFTITNNCGSTLDPGQTWTVDVPAGTQSGRVWGRTGCSFNGCSGSCQTGDCCVALSCMLSGQPPMTLAEFTIGGSQDFYDISVIDGYNLPMLFSCSTGVTLNCGGSSCPDAYLFPADNTKTHACSGSSNYQVTFCP
ncbi:unnamed protein product [Miscanthus lutarioriparius]|uniref:Thaumatin-like protein n=1 Tax=Miscanthus lutarioriparius TaxID=422564 RepID=A0A811R9T4_9POAL|nr:unnamed protein product [Miscanthus lutarioriparius]